MLFLMQPLDGSHTQSYWLTWNNGSDYNGGAGDVSQSSPATAVGGCSNLDRNGLNDLANLPATDYWGNDMLNGHASYKSVTQNQPTVGNNFENTTLNAADSAGYKIRSSAAIPGGTVIYAIGYTGNGGLNAELLNRLANSKNSTSYDNTQQVGMYVQVDNIANLNAAFAAVASDLLRLAQ